MKPSISSLFFNNLDPYEMAKTFVDIGFYQTEINERHYMPFFHREMDVREYRKYIDDLGFSVLQGHLFFHNKGNITSLDNAYAISNLKRALDVFYELGVKAAVLHYVNFETSVAPVEAFFDVRVNALNQLISHIQGTDMSICLENLSSIYDFDAGYLLTLCQAVDHPEHMGICLDTGHLHLAQRGNQYDFIMQAGKFLKAMHVHDNRGEYCGLKDGSCDWHSMPFDVGTIKWNDVKRGVRDSQYEGLFSFELGCRAPLEIQKLQAKYLLDCYNTFFAY